MVLSLPVQGRTRVKVGFHLYLCLERLQLKPLLYLSLSVPAIRFGLKVESCPVDDNSVQFYFLSFFM